MPETLPAPVLQKTWPCWYDILGQEYRAGDLVAYAGLWGDVVQLVIARVVRINRLRPTGQPILRFTRLPDMTFEAVPSATVTVKPIKESRNQFRLGLMRTSGPVRIIEDEDCDLSSVRAVTLQTPENIIKLVEKEHEIP